jgi:hypothetical protein
MKIAYDSEGRILMTGSRLPSELNGVALSHSDLSPEMEEAYFEAARNSAGVLFKDGAFEPIPQSAPTPVEVINDIEQKNPITHRALRELILTIGELHPAGKETVFYKRVLQTEVAIQAERAKL